MRQSKATEPTEPNKAEKEKRYRDIADTVRQASDDPEFVTSLEEQLARRELVRNLMALRVAAGLSQKEIATKLDSTQSRVSKLEASEDADLRFADLAAYAGALGFNARVLLR
jgi:predicted XRE-type DNA-binding protein